MLNINTNLEEQCKDKKKQTAKHKIITNPKNNTQKTNTNDNWNNVWIFVQYKKVLSTYLKTALLKLEELILKSL